ncbi:peptidoglycan bridge formation glycyltransferase FemA/FemB family protein [Streptococcus suis]|uniref:peptidoglycan bridge formation glycyltransferase FemA/FemB family protein n=1 Tax=Streptococcus suis TaxID=1307 RepID=UPI0014785C89
MTLRVITEQEFQAHIDQAKSQLFEQSPEMANLLKKRGYEVTILGYEVEGDLEVSAILFSTPIAGGLHMELHNGPIYTDETYLQDFYKELQHFAKKMQAIELKVKPYQSLQEFDTNGNPTTDINHTIIDELTSIGYHHQGLHVGYSTGDWYYIKDLTGLTQENLFQSFSKKGKPLIKKAKTFGISIRKLERDQLALFQKITVATSDRRDFNDKPLEYYEYLYDSFGDKAEFLIASLNFKNYLDNLAREQEGLSSKIDQLQANLLQNPTSEKKQNQLRELKSQYETFEIRKEEARNMIEKYGQQDVPLCASLFVYLKKEAYYLNSGSYPEFNKFYAPAILQEHVMLEAIKRGCQSYNFLGISGQFDGSDGVLRFKQNFNGYIKRTPGVFMYYPNPLKHSLIQVVKKVLGRY